MAESVKCALDSIGRQSDHRGARYNKLETRTSEIRHYFAFQAEKVKNVMNNRRERAKYRQLTPDCERICQRRNIHLARLLCIGVEALSDEEEETENTYLLGRPDRRRYHSCDHLQEEEEEEVPRGRGVRGVVVEAGGRLRGILRQAGHWFLDGLRGYTEFGNPGTSPGLSGPTWMEEPYCAFTASLPC